MGCANFGLAGGWRRTTMRQQRSTLGQESGGRRHDRQLRCELSEIARALARNAVSSQRLLLSSSDAHRPARVHSLSARNFTDMYTSNMEVVLSNHGVEVVPSPPPRPASAWRSPRSRPQSARPSGRPGSARARSPPAGFDDSPFIPSKEEPSAWAPKREGLNSVTTLIRAPLPPRPASAVPRRSPHKGPITDQLEAQLSKTARVLSVANEQLAEERRRVLLARRAEAAAAVGEGSVELA